MSVTQKLTAPARLVLRTGRDVAEGLFGVGRELVGRVVPGSGTSEAERPASSVAMPARAAQAPAPPAPVAAPVAPPAGTIEPDRTEQPEFQPVHLDEEPADVVYSSSDEGAQDGAGASLHIGEPWNGYKGMTAPDVVDRLAVADSATLAAVQLYESANRDRKTVLAAVDERLARMS